MKGKTYYSYQATSKGFTVRGYLYFKYLHMVYQYFVGIDVSKASLDISLLNVEELLSHQKIANTLPAIKEWFSRLKKEFKAGGKNTLVCLEHIGTYNTFLVEFLQKKKVPLWLVSPLSIKRSLGLQRGKNDKVDSYRIAFFAQLNQRSAKLFEPPRLILQELKQLNKLRSRLLTALQRLQQPLEEERSFQKFKASLMIEQRCQKSVAALRSDMIEVEEGMRRLITSDEHLHHLFELITSVDGVGERIAIEVLVATDEFKRCTTAKKLACYCGIAPFERTSGSSLRGKMHVSPLANRALKTLLHMPVLAIIKNKGSLYQYYQRKVEEGHHKLSVINALKNKLLQRIFACVREDRPYQTTCPVCNGRTKGQ